MLDLRAIVDDYLQRCFAAEERPRVTELAVLLDVSREHVSRQFAAIYGNSLSGYLKQAQLAYAKQLLVASSLSTCRIAYMAGYGTRRNFHRVFRVSTGTSPDVFRRSRNVSSQNDEASAPYPQSSRVPQ
ncbi:MAG TPA: AraC family transcriptional regulator [Thermoanaerobaculia bacterium]